MREREREYQISISIQTHRETVLLVTEREMYIIQHITTLIYITLRAMRLLTCNLLVSRPNCFTCFDEFNKTLCTSNISPYYIPTNTNFNPKAKRPA